MLKIIYFSVDQIGENYVECENNDGKMYYFKIKDVPKNIREGDILIFNKNGKLVKDKHKTSETKEKIKNAYNQLLE